jgi:Holliday junction resolvase RusA-like endonuclease
MPICGEDSSEKLIVFTVPYLTPPSVNHYTQTCYYTGKDGFAHIGKKLTPAARAYKEAVALFARGRSVAPYTDKERRKAKYRVEVHIYLGRNQRLDADNGSKLALDALVYAGVIHSDTFVDTRLVPHKDERENPRTEYIVERLES